MADVINEMSLKPAPAFLLGLVNCHCTALPGRPRPTVPPHWLLSIVLLTILDLLNALYSVCQRRNDSEQDWVITNSGGTTHTRCHVSVTLSLGLTIVSAFPEDRH